MFIDLMPLAVHNSLNFLSLVQFMIKDNCTMLWCGQNLDNLYNLGATGRFNLSVNGFADLFRRYFINESYLVSFKDVDGGNFFNDYFQKVIGLFGAKIYGHLKKTNVKTPKNAHELVINFNKSYDNVVFTEKSNDVTFSKWDIPKIPQEVRNLMFYNKINNYLSSGASQAVYFSSKTSGVDVIFPYSSELMIPVLKQLRMTLKDVLKPKRYLYKYINEFRNDLGGSINLFDKQCITNKEKKIISDAPNDHYCANMILNTTEFGQRLKTFSKFKVCPNSYTAMQYFQSCLIGYWKSKIWEKLKKMEIEIVE